MAEKELKLKFTSSGMPAVLADFTQLRQASHLTAQTVGRINIALGRTGQLLGGANAASSVLGQFGQLGNVAAGVATGISAVAGALASIDKSRSGVIAAAAAIAGIGIATALTLKATKDIQGPAKATLSGGIGDRIETIQARVDELRVAGRLTQEQVKFYENELARIRKMEDHFFLEALGDQPEKEMLQADALSAIWQRLRDDQSKLIEKERETNETRIESKKLTVEQAEATGQGRIEIGRYLDGLEEELQLRQSISNMQLKEGMISQNEAIRERVRITRELLEIENKRKALRLESVATRTAQINRGTDAENEAFRHDVPGQIISSIIEIQQQLGTTAEIIARGFGSVAMGAVNSVAEGIRGLLMLTTSWGDALRNIGIGVFNEIINAISRMAAEFIVSHIIMAGVLKGFHLLARLLGWETTTEQIAQESAKAPSLAMNAATASVGSYGASAVVGIALAIAAIGALVAYAAGAFKEGGYTGNGGTSDVAGVVHGQEFVFSAPAVDRIGLPALEALHRGGDMPSGMGIKVVNVWSEQEFVDMVANSPENERIIVNTMGRNAHRFRT